MNTACEPKVYNKYDHVCPPKEAVYIGRGSKYGNKFYIGKVYNGKIADRDDVCDMYEASIEANPKLKAEIIEELRGKDLICYCAPRRCHGDYLLRIANK